MQQSGVTCRRLGFAATILSCVTTSALALEDAKPGRPANRLASETSPYLRLHAHNPVDWYPWGPEALEKARRENKPIFLSIGYSSCFWCHVMERKVFENEEIAAYMNEHFVNIKVDREERPDLDDLYMLALQVYLQATGSGAGGGWPLSIFLTPDGKPIAGGTYFPPEDMPGRPGFPSVLKQVHNLWVSKEATIRESSEILAREVRRLSKPQAAEQATEIPAGLVKQAIKELAASYDPDYGGFDFNPKSPDGPKFPQPCKLLFLEWAAGRDATGQIATMLDATLTQMLNGGLYDHLGGGFHRYSTDRQWRIPHFEKMLYDNAQLAEVYAAAAKRTGRADFKRAALETIAFVLRDLCDPQGGFYSALDAETNGVEGAYYVWSKGEIDKVLGDGSKLFFAAYGLEEPSPFEHGYVLYRARSDDDLAKQFSMAAVDVAPKLAALGAELLKVRQQRPALLRDDKILASWNGLMIRALARCGQLVEEPACTAAAERAAVFVLGQMRSTEGQLYRSWCEGQPKYDAYLDDYAAMIDGLLALHQSTGDAKWLNAARRLTDDQIKGFWDAEAGGFFYTSHDHEQLLARLKDGYDSVMPSGNGISASVLLDLAERTSEPRYRQHASQTLLAFAAPMERSPSGYVRMVEAAEGLAAAGESGAAVPETSRQVAAGPSTAKRPSSRPSEKPAAAEKLKVGAEAPAEELKKHEQVTAKTYLAADHLTPGGDCRIAVVLDVAKGWHVNANPPVPDTVVPIELEMTSKAGAELVDVVYPKGDEVSVDGEANSVHHGQVVVYATVKLPPNVTAGEADLQFTLLYQACKEPENGVGGLCLAPKRYKMSGTALVGKSGKPINASLFDAEAKKGSGDE